MKQAKTSARKSVSAWWYYLLVLNMASWHKDDGLFFLSYVSINMLNISAVITHARHIDQHRLWCHNRPPYVHHKISRIPPFSTVFDILYTRHETRYRLEKFIRSTILATYNFVTSLYLQTVLSSGATMSIDGSHILSLVSVVMTDQRERCVEIWIFHHQYTPMTNMLQL